MADQMINGLPVKTAPQTGDKLLIIGAAEEQLVDYDKLADAILNKLTSKSFTLDQGTMTLLAALNALNSNLKDSGWIFPDISNFKVFNDGEAEKVRYRKIGKKVIVKGIVSPLDKTKLANGASSTIFTLPPGFRAESTYTRICQGTSQGIFLLQITANGNVSLARYRKGGEYLATVQEDTWLPFYAEYVIG